MEFQPFPQSETYLLEELKNRLKALKEHGFLPIFGKVRSAAFGESVEKYLGLQKDSSRSADWGEYELKTTSMKSNRIIGLFSVKWNYQDDYNDKKLLLIL